mgnify:CR=1 FL=1
MLDRADMLEVVVRRGDERADDDVRDREQSAACHVVTVPGIGHPHRPAPPPLLHATRLTAGAARQPAALWRHPPGRRPPSAEGTTQAGHTAVVVNTGGGLKYR